MSQDGTLAFWKNNLSLEKSMKLGAANDDPTRTSKNIWITDCVVVPGHNRNRFNLASPILYSLYSIDNLVYRLYGIVLNVDKEFLHSQEIAIL